MNGSRAGDGQFHNTLRAGAAVLRDSQAGATVSLGRTAREAWLNAGAAAVYAAEICNSWRSAIKPRPVGFHPNRLRVCSLEAGISRLAKWASQPK